jgi:NitT/TauT family transport system ATP-binding protein
MSLKPKKHEAGLFRERENHQAPRVRFESELEDHLSRDDAEKTLRALTAWARYAELFDYDSRSRTFTCRPGTS